MLTVVIRAVRRTLDAPRVPVASGDHVVVHGEYVWNAQGGLIHFTHHDPQGTHEAGYIQDNGKTYD